MKGEQWFQCGNCGKLFCADAQVDIDELYTVIKCPRCRGETKCLWVGNNPWDVYAYGNANLDPRFYEYENNTK